MARTLFDIDGETSLRAVLEENGSTCYLSYSIRCPPNYDLVLYTHEINIPNNINQFNPTKTQF